MLNDLIKTIPSVRLGLYRGTKLYNLIENQLIKEAEGHEAVLITSTNLEDWQNADDFLEVGTKENANEIYSHLNQIGVNIFSQKIGWKKAGSVNDIPVSHREGLIFITKKDEMSW